MSTSHHKSRIPAISSCRSVKPGHSSRLDLSSHGNSIYENSYRYGQFSTQRKSSTSCFKPNKNSAFYSNSTFKVAAKGLFSQSPKTEQRNKVHYASSAAASGRRSSIMGDRNRQKDTRQLSDSTYQQSCIAKLIKFLTENAYPNPISPKFLKAPSKQDVIKVFEFIFSKLDPNIEVVPLDVKIPELMTQIGYPYYFSKSTLVSFTGRQAIGTLLGMFEFLVDIAIYIQSIDTDELIYPSVTTDEALLKTAILQISTDDEENEDNALNELAAKTYGTHDQLEAEEIEEKKWDLEIVNLQKDNEYRLSVPKQILEYNKSTEEYATYNHYMDEYIARNKDESSKLDEGNTELEKELAILAEQLNEINQRVNDQPYDVAEMQLARDRQLQFDKEINEDTKMIKQTKLEIHSTANEISSTKDQLAKKNDAFAAEVNSLLMSINTHVKTYAPWTIEKLHSSELQDVLDQLSGPDSLTNSVELKKRFVDTLNEINKFLIEASVDLSVKLVKVQQKEKELEMVEAEKKRELKQLQDNLAKVEQEFQRHKQQAHEEYKSLDEKYTHLKKTLTTEEINLKECVKSNETCINQLRAEVAQQTLKNKEQKDRNEATLRNRRETVTKLLDLVEKSLTKIHEMERKSVDTLKTSVTVCRVVLERIQHKLEDGKKNAKNSSDKTQDLSKGERIETSTISSSCSKENVSIN